VFRIKERAYLGIENRFIGDAGKKDIRLVSDSEIPDQRAFTFKEEKTNS